MKRTLTIIILLLLFISYGCKKSTEKVPEKLYVSSNKGVILRANPDVSSKIITTIPFMTEVGVIEQNKEQIFLADRYGKWTKIKYNNFEGWAFSGFLSQFNIEPLYEISSKFHSNFFKNTDCFKKTSPGYPSYEYVMKLSSLKSSDIKIDTIIDNYIVIRFPHTASDSCSDTAEGNALWFYNSEKKTFENIKSTPDGGSIWIHAKFLNNDNFADYTLSRGCCGYWDTEIYLGDKNGNFILNKTISCSDDPGNTSDPLCDDKKLMEYYSKK